MNRNLLKALGLALLTVPLAAGDILPLPPPPVEDIEWVPTDAMAYGVGGGVMEEVGCEGAYTITIVLFDETETDGGWSTSFEYQLDPTKWPGAIVEGSTCGALLLSPIFLESRDFDPATGGCFGGLYPSDADKLCLEFLAQDALTGVVTYGAEDEGFSSTGPSHFYSGEIQVAFAGLPDV